MQLTAGEFTNVFLNPQDLLTVVTAADSTAIITRLGNKAGDAPISSTSVAASQTQVFGPFNYGTRYFIRVLTGSVTISTSLVDLTAMTTAKSEYGLDLYGTPAADYSGAGNPTPSVADIRFHNQLLFVVLSTAITANVTVTTAPAGSVGITSHATGVGKLFMSDGSKWQFAVVA